MDINNAASSRADYYDRGAITVNIGFTSAPIGPHGATIRDTYVVPVNRKAIINFIDVGANIVTAPGASGNFRVYLRHRPDGGPNNPFLTLRSYSLTAGLDIHTKVSPMFVMYPDDVLTISTQDLRAGGTVAYDCDLSITEFDF